ncbi:hypothetical protein K501DRAFT_268014 [Backusella circina FSU 941]|nr:hypothetical protein K501DRAFT_268014 [Backusella circina FSU 941]
MIDKEDSPKKQAIGMNSDMTFVNIEERYDPSEKSVKTLHETDSKAKRRLLIGLALCVCCANNTDVAIGPAIGRVAYDFHDSKNMSWTLLICISTNSGENIRLSGEVIRFYFVYNGQVINTSAFIGISVGVCQSVGLYITLYFMHLKILTNSVLLASSYSNGCLLLDLFSLEDRIKYQPISFTAYGVTCVISPIIGGILVDIPIKPEQRLSKTNMKALVTRIDPIGIILITIAVTLFLIGVNMGSLSKSYSWSSPLVIGLLVGSAIITLLFILFESFISSMPLFPSEIILDVRLGLAYLQVFLNGSQYVFFELFAFILYQSVYNASPTEAGLRLIPSTVCYILTNIAQSKITRLFRSSKICNVTGNLFTVIGSISLIYVQGIDTSIGVQIVCMITYGIGIGLCGQSAAVSAQLILEQKDPKLVATALGFVRCIIIFSGTVCTAIVLSLLQTQLLLNLENIRFSQPHIYESIIDSGAIYSYVKVHLVTSQDVLHSLQWIYLKSIKSTITMGLMCSIIERTPTIPHKKKVCDVECKE